MRKLTFRRAWMLNLPKSKFKNKNNQLLMKYILSILQLLCIVSIGNAQFSSEARIQLKIAVIKDYEKVFIMDSIGRNILADCTIDKLQGYYPKNAKPSQDSINVWYSKSIMSCIAANKSELKNCYSKWSAFPALSESTVKLLEGFIPVLKKVQQQDRAIMVTEILDILKLNYPIGFPFVVPPDVSKKMLEDFETRAKRNPKLKKYF